ncbi:unnamed protein product [Calicophoron daubneyi]|uniref:Mediator of RNA polymerase II transcription subunit 25 von Willebrand factor type A domain-containing protein n=1 Tax=Calicophoron daubneyi TaxID=300641 RepID=A0AAV2TS74_CALDB
MINEGNGLSNLEAVHISKEADIVNIDLMFFGPKTLIPNVEDPPARPFSNPSKLDDPEAFQLPNGVNPPADLLHLKFIRSSSAPNITLTHSSMYDLHTQPCYSNRILENLSHEPASTVTSTSPFFIDGIHEEPSINGCLPLDPRYSPEKENEWTSSSADFSLYFPTNAVSSACSSVVDPYVPSVSTQLAITPNKQAETVFDIDQMPSVENQNRMRLKRPHSAIDRSAELSTVDDGSVRPLSAPKRISEEHDSVCDLLADGNTVSFTAEDPTKVVSRPSISLPKSTLEALVASNSPLMFFPTGFSADADHKTSQLCDFLSASSEKSHPSPIDGFENCSADYNLDLGSNGPDFLTAEVESDALNANSSNSVSSSKSLVSLDLNETSLKGVEVRGSPKSNLSDLVVSSDAVTEVSNSAASQLNDFVKAMRSYAAELCPVDCVILVERCRPFNCDTHFMKYFRDQYLRPILSNLNGGPPLNADFGRDAYTSLYSLHGYYWRKPLSFTTWVPDTPIIYRILKRIESIQNEERHASEHTDATNGTPGHELLEVAVRAFDAIDKARRGLCKQVRRHLILLAVSPISLEELKKEDKLCLSDSESSANMGPLTNLRKRGVALSVFSPVRSESLPQLCELVNGAPSSLFYDRRWQTVVLSAKLLKGDSPDRRIVGPLAAAFHAQAESELALIEQRQLQQKHLQQQQHQQQQQQQQGQQQQVPNPPLVNGGHQQTVGGFNRVSPSSPRQQPSRQLNSYVANNQVMASNTSPGAAQEPTYRSHSGKTNVNNALSPVSVPYQYGVIESPMSQNYRTLRNSGQPCSQQPGSTPPGYVARSGMVRVNSESSRQLEPQIQQHVSVPCNSLSAGHSGPNSVDQAPGSVYGSDSVATPQGLSAGLMSPQQCYGAGQMSSQLHSPAGMGPNTVVNGQNSMQSVPPSTHTPGSQYVSGSNQVYQYQASNYDISGLRSNSVAPSSPNSSQASFRPPSNAASPGANFGPYVSTAGLPSPSAARPSTRQYSPQLTMHNQALSQARHTSPHPGAQPIRAHHLVSPDNSSGSNSRPNSMTPTNFVSTGAVGCSQQQFMNNSPITNATSRTVPYQNSHSVAVSSFSAYDSPSFRSCGPAATACSTYATSSQTTTISSRPEEYSTSGLSGPNSHRGMVGADVNLQRVDTVCYQPACPPQMPLIQSGRHQQPSPLDQSNCGRTFMWEGEAQLAESATVPVPARLNMRLILEQPASRDLSHANMQLWGHVAHLSVIHAHRDSLMVQRLCSPLPSGFILARVLVDVPQPEEAGTLVAALSTRVSQVALPLGILSPPPSSLPTPFPPGSIAFACLIYNPKRNRIYGLIPSDSEQFRQDVATKLYAKPVSTASGELTNGPSAQRPYLSSGVMSTRPTMNQEAEPGVNRMGGNMTGSNAPSSFFVANTGPSYGSNQRSVGPMNPGDRGPMEVPITCLTQSCPTQHANYQQGNLINQQQTSGQLNPMIANAKAQAPTQPNVQCMQRSTPSPICQREMMGSSSQSDPQPPPQWITSQQADQYMHPSQGQPMLPFQHQARSLKSNLQQQQQQQQQNMTQFSQRPSHEQQYASFQTQYRAPNDRMVPGSATGGGHMQQGTIVQAGIMNEPMVGSEQALQRNSPQQQGLSVNMSQAQLRFLPANSTFQGMPSVPSSYQMNDMTSQISNSATSSYVPMQAFGPQRSGFQSQTQHHLSHTNNSNINFNTASNNYHSRNVPPGSMSNSSSYRFMSGSSSMGFMPQQSGSTSKHQQHLGMSQMNAPGFSTIAARPQPGTMSVSGVVVDNSMASAQQSGHFSIPSQDIQQQRMLQAPMYGSVRLQQQQQHSAYDSCGAAGGPGFF